MKNNDKEDWLIFENHHEPIISKETFESVKKQFNKFTHKRCSDTFYNELKGKVYCKGCGQLLHRHYINNRLLGKTFYYKCDYGNNEDCCSDKAYIKDLKEVIIASVTAYMRIVVADIESLKQKHKSENTNSEQEISAICDEVSLLEKQILSEYTKYSSGSITREEFSVRREKISDKIHILNTKKEVLENELSLPNAVYDNQDLIDEFAQNEIVSDEMISTLINKIYLKSDKEISIEWNLENCFDEV